MTVDEILREQKAYFESGATLPVKFRAEMLRRLYLSIMSHENEIHNALRSDLGKCAYESYMCETGLVLSEISYMLRNLKLFARKKRVKTPISQFHAVSSVKPSPYGVALIISPWNYPFLLTFSPLVNALAAGNTAVLKPSANSPETSRVIAEITSECFGAEYVATVEGGRRENYELPGKKFDIIFFTGSKSVGKEVLRCAAENLTPSILELGGKSPCIVDKTANITVAARRIVFGKFLNCGQTCVAPDYVLCDKTVKDALEDAICTEIKNTFGNNVFQRDDYGTIVNERHFDRLIGLVDEEKTVMGGRYNRESLIIEPTVLDNVTFDDKVMQEEIFGPILPILTFDDITDAVKSVNKGDKPLALYIFSDDKKNIDYVTERCSFGGGCINDTVIHLATSEMGFGGVGESGMGAYHGKVGFDAFSHDKSIVDKKTWIDLPIRYRPYSKRKMRLLKLFLK